MATLLTKRGKRGRQVEYIVECLAGKRKRGRVVEYLVTWEGDANPKQTWEPASNVSDDLIAAYEEKGAPEASSSSPRASSSRTSSSSSRKRGVRPVDFAIVPPASTNNGDEDVLCESTSTNESDSDDLDSSDEEDVRDARTEEERELMPPPPWCS